MSDLTLTRELDDALKRLDIILADHIIVACGGWHSIKTGETVK